MKRITPQNMTEEDEATIRQAINRFTREAPPHKIYRDWNKIFFFFSSLVSWLVVNNVMCAPSIVKKLLKEQGGRYQGDKKQWMLPTV